MGGSNDELPAEEESDDEGRGELSKAICCRAFFSVSIECVSVVQGCDNKSGLYRPENASYSTNKHTH